MIKKITMFAVMVFFLANIYGCFALFAGAAGGAGTAVWLSGKVTEEVNAPFDRTVKAAERALESMKLAVTKKTVETEVAQLKSEYTDGKTIWIDIHRITDRSSKVEVRVGAVQGDKEASTRIMERIQRYL